MIKRKADDDRVSDSSVVKLYGAPPPLKDDLIRRLQDAVDAARQKRSAMPKRSMNFFLDAKPDEGATSG